MTAYDDRLLERDLAEVLGGDGPPADLEARIIDAVERGSARPRAARSRAPSRRLRGARRSAGPGSLALLGALTAAAAAFGVAVHLLDQRQPRPQTPDVTTSEERPSRTTTTAPAGDPEEPTPPPLVREDEGEGEDEASPSLIDLPEVAPEEEPLPDRVVVEAPPGPRTEATAPTRAQPLAGALLASADVRVRDADGERWRAPGDAALRSGTRLRARRPADVDLEGGARLRFVGEVTLEVTAPAAGAPVEVAVRLAGSTQAYVDGVGARGRYRVASGDAEVALDDGAALVASQRGALVVACYAGAARVGGEALAAGERGRVAGERLRDRRPLSEAERRPALLAGMTPRRLWREELGRPTAGRLGAGRVQAGFARCEGNGARLTVLFPPSFTLAPAARLRVRHRVASARALYVQLTLPDDRQYGKWFPVVGAGAWETLDVPVADLLCDSGGPQDPPPAGVTLTNVNLIVQEGDARATLDVEWVELVRTHD